MIYELRLPANVLESAKQPYDEDAHGALLYAAKKAWGLSHLDMLVTDDRIFLDVPEGYLVQQLAHTISYITAMLSKWWPRKLVVLDVIDTDMSMDQAKKHIAKYSKGAYECFLENPEFHKEPSLFGNSFYLPYEKTPQYFREGILVDESVLS